MITAAVDIGSNAIRLIIAEVEDEKIVRILHKDRIITRLAAGLNKSGALSEEPVERTVDALKSFIPAIKKYSPEKIVTAATSAVRESSNPELLIHKAAEVGYSVIVIPGEQEAGLIYEGAKQAVSSTDRQILLFDIGGGSTEFVCGKGEDKAGISVPLGVVKIADMFDFSDILNHEIMDRMKIPIHGVLNTVMQNMNCEPEVLIGTAGTPTTLAAIAQKLGDYDSSKINGYELSLETIEEIFNNLCNMTARDRIDIPGMEKGREDLIIPGTLITTELMKMTGVHTLTVSDYGLREGLVVAASVS